MLQKYFLNKKYMYWYLKNKYNLPILFKAISFLPSISNNDSFDGIIKLSQHLKSISSNLKFLPPAKITNATLYKS